MYLLIKDNEKEEKFRYSILNVSEIAYTKRTILFRSRIICHNLIYNFYKATANNIAAKLMRKLN